MKTFTVAVVEDSADGRAAIKTALENYSKQKSVTFETTYYDCAEVFLSHDMSVIDILLMDIELPGNTDGFTAAKRFREANADSILIFVTNMRKYAIKGYEVGALNYILKPINYYGFSLTLDRAIRQLDNRRSETIRIRTANGFKAVNIRNVFYIEIMKHDVMFYTTDGVITNYGTLREWELKLAPLKFVRCSSSVLINLWHVSGVSGDDVIVAGTPIRISRAKKKEFLKIVADYYGDSI